MNMLSWTFLLTDIINDLQTFAIFITITSIFITTIILFKWTMDETDRKSNDEKRKTFKKLLKKSVMTAIVSMMIIIAIPSKQTIYMVTASQLGETVITNPETQELFEDLKSIIRSYAEETQG